MLSLASAGHAAAATGWNAGEYLSEGGYGRLVISTRAGETRFDLDEQGVNGHSCSVDGVITGREAKLNASTPGQLCVVKFSPTAQGIAVAHDSSDGCRNFCGARADFGGEYLRPEPGCTRAQQQASRKSFNTLYRAKSYATALAVLSPVLNRCGRLQHWMTNAAIRNDVAITQYHLGQRAECLKTLQPLEARTTNSEAELKALLPPVDFESFLSTAKATWHNKRLCSTAP
ncbi:MAG: hypothetical protein RLZZ618_2274 [Pseudomonadota bacterium]